MSLRKMMLLSAVILVLGASTVVAKHFWRGETLSPERVESRWGNDVFEVQKFKVATPQERAKMAASLLRGKKKFIGLDRAEIRRQLGDFDGFYFSDMFPTYMIELGKTVQEESWQIVFLLDRKESVDDIVVHKNCCDKR